MEANYFTEDDEFPDDAAAAASGSRWMGSDRWEEVWMLGREARKEVVNVGMVDVEIVEGECGRLADEDEDELL